jgi:hypothetical protein
VLRLLQLNGLLEMPGRGGTENVGRLGIAHAPGHLEAQFCVVAVIASRLHGHALQRDNYDGRLPTIKLAKSGSRRVARRELPV